MFLELFRELVVMCKDETCAEIGLISIAINLHKLRLQPQQPQCRQGQTPKQTRTQPATCAFQV